MIANAIHVLCALTSALCAVLLFRSWRNTRVRLLFWGCLCFTGFALNNLLLVIDLRMDRVDLAGIRLLPALIGMALLLYGLIRNEA
jgi:hypothetical protein